MPAKKKAAKKTGGRKAFRLRPRPDPIETEPELRRSQAKRPKK
jgi:hypothetical protein